MHTTQYYKEKFAKIPFALFCETTLEDEAAKCALGWLGVEECHISKWYNINSIPEAKDFNYLFVKYFYPILKSKGVYYNELLLEQGKIVFGINDNELKICLPLGINHKTIKGRIIQALTKIEEIIKSEELLQIAMEAEEAEFKVVS